MAKLAVRAADSQAQNRVAHAMTAVERIAGLLRKSPAHTMALHHENRVTACQFAEVLLSFGISTENVHKRLLCAACQLHSRSARLSIWDMVVSTAFARQES